MKPKLAIIGGGACALMLASEIDTNKFDVCIYEANKNLGRKFLVAGDGGLNLTHSEEPKDFILKYHPYQFLEPAFNFFSNLQLMAWLKKQGIETFVGSSKRVFPKKGIKPIEVLNVFLKKIKENGVHIKFEHELIHFDGVSNMTFSNHNNKVNYQYQYIVFCLGGASWPITGSKGNWLSLFQNHKIQTKPFKASNCAYKVNWHHDFIHAHQGKALKNISLTCANKINFGEVVLSSFGIEGSGIYPLSPFIRSQLESEGRSEIFIDFKPGLTLQEIKMRLTNDDASKLTQRLKVQLNLNATQIALIKHNISKQAFLNVNSLAQAIKKLPLIIVDTAQIDEAISTIGGIDLNEINQKFELKKLNNHYVIGEMLDFDAPTGGYLLQSCFSMANYLANELNQLN